MRRYPDIKASGLEQKLSPIDERLSHSEISSNFSELPAGMPLSPHRPRLAKVTGSDKVLPQSLENSEIPSPNSWKCGKIRLFDYLTTITRPRSEVKRRAASTALAVTPIRRPQSASERLSTSTRRLSKDSEHVDAAPALGISPKSKPVHTGHRKDTEILNVKSDGKTEHSNQLSPTLNRLELSPKSLDAQSKLMKKILEIKVKTTSLCVEHG